MRHTPFFAGDNTAPSYRNRARDIATKLGHTGISYNLLWSSASYVLRDGRAPRDSVVVAEARRREGMLP
jgi:hypothetical protein